MAQDRADLTPTSTLERPNVPARLKEPGENTGAIDRVSMHTIDKLLALTDEGWDIDDQVRSLQNVAEEKRSSTQPPPPVLQRPGPLRLPTPYELSPLAVAKEPLSARQKQSVPPPLPAPAKPPPRSKGPPPLPGRAPADSSGSVRPPLLPSAKQDPLSSAILLDLLTARIGALEAGDDKVGLARVHMEMAIAHELLADEARAVTHAEAALNIDPDLAASHAMLRRRKHGRASLALMLDHLDHELAAATEEAGRVELLVERARLLDATGERSDAVRGAWEQALTHAPHHAAALRGLEAEIVARVNAQPTSDGYDALAAHVGHMADAYGSEHRLAAWLHVERAQILERKLGRVDAARGALERALELDPGVGPVREAYVRHVSARQDAAALVMALDQEAHIEPNPHRSARLELDAACIANDRLGDPGRAISLLERAAERGPTVPNVDRRILDDLVRLREARGEWGQAARARRARLRFITDPPIVAQELRALAAIAERLGEHETAMIDVQRALAIDGTDPTLVETLDRLLASENKHDQRASLWLSEAARTEEGPKRARALMRAAHIAEHILGRPADAVRHLRAAWVAQPGDPEVLDALSRLLTPAPSETVDGDGRALIDLYAQAAETARDDGRRIAYLEKIALVWEDIIGEARRATKTYEQILELEPDRRSAILGLARNAARINDDRSLARALLEEARLADDGVDALSLKSRAATALSRVDPARALALVNDVLAQEPAHATARALETRIHEEARRWDAAASSIKRRIEHVPPAEKVALWLALAQLQDTRLHAPHDALASLKAAHALDPNHPVPPEAIARMLETSGDYTTLRDALQQLAKDAKAPDERARHLMRAAEIEEFRLGDDSQAAALYAKALDETPDDELIACRLIRVLARRATTNASTTALATLAALTRNGSKEAKTSTLPPPSRRPSPASPPPRAARRRPRRSSPSSMRSASSSRAIRARRAPSPSSSLRGSSRRGRTRHARRRSSRRCSPRTPTTSPR